MVTWVHVDEPTDDESGELIASIEAALGHQIHPVADAHLRRRRTDLSHAFPRCESHYDRYLFGQLHLPTAMDDGVAEFLELTYVATMTQVWSVIRSSPSKGPILDSFRLRLDRAQTDASNYETAGDLIGRVMTVVVSELEKALDETDHIVDSLMKEMESIEEDRHLSLAIKKRVPGLRSQVSDVRKELVGLGTVVDQMSSVVTSIVRDEVDLLGEVGGVETEFFGRTTEIWLQDTQVRAKRLRVIHDEQLEMLELITEGIRQLHEADEVTSGRFIGAIASIMLFPTFIVGLYGMNFEKMPELHWHLGYVFAAVLIVGVTIMQIRYFRGRGWL